MAMPETSKDAETITLSRVASPSSSNFDGKIVMVTPKREFCICFEQIEIVRPVQETSEPAAGSAAELVINNFCETKK